MSFPFFSKKEKKPARMQAVQKHVEMPEELYPELPEIPELKEPESLPLKQASPERVRAAVERKEPEMARPLMPEPSAMAPEIIMPEDIEEKPQTKQATSYQPQAPSFKPFIDDSGLRNRPESIKKSEWLTEQEEEKAHTEKRERRAFSPTKPAFMEGADFRKAITNLNKAMKKPAKLKTIENEEERRLTELHTDLEDIQRKIVLMDRTIFGG